MTRHRPTTDLREPTSLPADRGKWAVSGMNGAIIGIIAASALVPAAQGRWGDVYHPLVMAFLWWGVSRMARWRDSTDQERVLSFEPADEREEAIARDGLATTGKFALLFLLAQSILLFHLAPQLWPYSVGTLGLFAVVWYAATSRAVRRA